ncbi:vWA domain-containing protein [Rhodococcus sp. NPDC003348]
MPGRGVDVAAFAVALGVRLRDAGVEVSPPAAGEFARALAVLPPSSSDRLYWAARLTLVHRQSDLAAFDEVFSEVFGRSVAELDPNARRAHQVPNPQGTTTTATSHPPAPVRPGSGGAAAVATLRPVRSEPARGIPDPLASAGVAAGARPFAAFDADRLRELRAWLDGLTEEWPPRRTRRYRPHPSGRRIALRETIARSRRTGWEAMRIVRTLPATRPRRVVLLCDVSRSMLPFVDQCLHLMRATALRSGTRARPEVYAFSSGPTRLTAVLAHRSATAALAHANERVVDRLGGTRIAGSLRTLLASRHGLTLRGAVVVIVSDGWDSDPPEDLAVSMARLHRRAYRVIWINPRADAPGFRPLVGSMAAALPYVDRFVAAAPPVRTSGGRRHRKGAQVRSAYR